MLIAREQLLDPLVFFLDLAVLGILRIVDHVGEQFAKEVDAGLR